VGRIGPAAEDVHGRCGRQHVAGQQQLDCQQVLEQADRRVGLADAQRRGRVVVLDAEI
jgi:hypothetical protein